MLTDKTRTYDLTTEARIKVSLWRRLFNHRRYIVIFTVPLLLLPLPIVHNTEVSENPDLPPYD